MNESTATLITTADRSVKAITAATAGLSKVVADVIALNGVVETLSADIQQKEGQLADLERQLNIGERNAKAELNVRVAEAENVVLNQLLQKNDLARISNTTLSELQDNLSDARSTVELAVADAVKAAESALHASYGGKLRSQEADFKVANAEGTARISALSERNQFLVEELAKARQDLVAEREARIKIAQAEAGRQGVVVNAGKQ